MRYGINYVPKRNIPVVGTVEPTLEPSMPAIAPEPEPRLFADMQLTASDYPEEIQLRAFREHFPLHPDDADPILSAYIPHSVQRPVNESMVSPLEAEPSRRRYLLSHKEPQNTALDAFAHEVQQDLEQRLADALRNALPQPDTIVSRIKTGDEIYLAHYRVTDRIPRTPLTVEAAELLCHELDNQVDPAMLRALDEPLYLKEKLKDVYMYLGRSMNDDFLAYAPRDADQDMMPTALTSTSQIAHVFNSNSIRTGNIPQFNRIVLNKDLHQPECERMQNGKSLYSQLVCRSFTSLISFH